MKATQGQIDYCNILKTTTRASYNAIGKVNCPVLGSDIGFNSIGFRHLLYKPDGTPRDIKEIIYKLILFPLVVPVILNALGVDEERKVTIRDRRGKKFKMKNGKTIALVAEVGRKKPVRVRVLILQLDGAPNPIFYSVMKD